MTKPLTAHVRLIPLGHPRQQRERTDPVTTAPTPPRANALACEYRPSMPADVLHLWAKDAVAELIRLRAELEARKPPPLSDEQIERLREQAFSTNNPFCPCDNKTMRKAVRAAERAHGITGGSS